MAFNIVDFKARGLSLGGTQPSLFQVNLTFPASVAAPTVADKGSFVCSASQLPPSQVGEVNIPYFGRMVKYKGDRTFPDWDVTVLNDEDFMLRDAFESWQNQMNYLESNIMDTAFVAQGYKQDIFILQYAKDGLPNPGGGQGSGHVIREYKMVGAWPSNVSPINVSWGDQNSIETFTVSFAYDYWIPEGATSSMNEF